MQHLSSVRGLAWGAGCIRHEWCEGLAWGDILCALQYVSK